MRNIATKADGVDSLAAGDFNASQDELEKAVTSSDQTLDPAGGADTDLNMLAKAMAGYANAGWGYTESGSANAHVASIASNLKPPTKYYDNMIIAYIPGNDNTSTTVTVNVSTLGAKNIKLVGGTDPSVGEIRNDRVLLLKYNDGAGYFEILSGNYLENNIQSVRTDDGAVATGTTVMVVDDTIPQNTEGDQYLSQAITPKNANHKLKIRVVLHLSHSAVTPVFVGALFKDSDAGALKAGTLTSQQNAAIQQLIIEHEMTAGTTSTITFKVRAGAVAAGTTTFNGITGARIFGGVINSFIEVEEIK